MKTIGDDGGEALKRSMTPRESIKAGVAADPDLIAAPLYSAPAELAVLSSMIAHPSDVMDKVVDVLNARDFFVPAHQVMYSALVFLYEQKRTIDITVLAEYLKDHGNLEVVGGYSLIAEMCANLVTHLNIASHIEIVRKKSVLRRLQVACVNIVQGIADNPDEVDGLLDDAERTVLEISTEGAETREEPFSTAIHETLADIARFEAAGKKVTGLPTGFWRLDDYTTGWQGGQMIVLGARPGVGKTALAMKFMMHLLNPRYGPETGVLPDPALPCAAFSLEMSEKELAMRFLSMHSGVRMQKLRTGRLTEEEEKQMLCASRNMKEWPLYVDDSGSLDVMQFRARLRRMVKKYRIRFAVVDYIQLLRAKRNKGNRQEEVSEISRTIKMTARELDIPIFVNAQLNRPKEGGDTDKPQLHHLRESGAIEQDADIILLLHNRNEVRKKYKLYDLILAKQRSGPTGEMTLGYCGGEVLFEELPDADLEAGAEK